MMWTRVFVVALLAAVARGDDAFYRVAVKDLKFTRGSLPVQGDGGDAWRRPMLTGAMRPYIVADGSAEAYLADAEGGAGAAAFPWRMSFDELWVVARGETGKDVTGVLVVPRGDWSGMEVLEFSIPAAAAEPLKVEFYQTKESHYEALSTEPMPGAAWFRRQATEAHRLSGRPDDEEAVLRRRPRPPMTDTYDLFSGGHALSENLQLARDLPPANLAAPEPEKTVPLSEIPGITVRPMQFDKVEGVSLDELASAIPADQHAVFFSSFLALMVMSDEMNGGGLPLFRGMTTRSEDGRIAERYQRQLCLQLSKVARLLGPKAIASVAITGSDPYFPTGTDVALVFRPVDGADLRTLLLNQVRANAAGLNAEAVSGAEDGIGYEGMATADRSVCSYVATIGGNVVVTNSKVQLRRLGAVANGGASLASLEEYRFFRSRYVLGAEQETAFVFLSDATIRRWCGPEWRIGASRRVRAAAIMSDVAAANMDALVKGVDGPWPVTADTPMRTIGELTLDASGVRSSVYGGLGFLTPIAELGITEAAPDEASSYKQWRDTYQRNWSWAFDPIGIRFSVNPGRLSADMTVMPLIASTQYRSWIEVSRGVSIAAGAGDPHDSILHAVFAINKDAPSVRNTAGMARMFAPEVEIDPLGWLGPSVAIYADPDPVWAEIGKAARPDAFPLEDFAWRLPIALHAQVESALKLTAFLGAVRGWLEQSSPGMLEWETRKHGEQPYVRIGLAERARNEGNGFDKLNVYYAAMPRSLIVSINEQTLQRAIDRAAAPEPKRPVPWPGESMNLVVTRDGAQVLAGIDGGASVNTLPQAGSWANLPILNEWKRRYPDRDPVEVHRERWGSVLVCPGGGLYQWNERYRTMESTVYGHPGEPKTGPGPLDLHPAKGLLRGEFGLTFEEQGLRAKASVEREPSQP